MKQPKVISCFMDSGFIKVPSGALESSPKDFSVKSNGTSLSKSIHAKTVNELENLIEFVHKFTNVKRSACVKGRVELQNDVEHSYELAIVVWFISDRLKLGLNKQKLFEYALIHDLVEVYAGDTDPFQSSKKRLASKKERERKSFKKIKKELIFFSSLSHSIKEYEKHKDEESKLVYLIDKILAVIGVGLCKHSYYKDNCVSFIKWIEWLESKKNKVSCNNKDIIKLLDEFLLSLEKKKRALFKETKKD